MQAVLLSEKKDESILLIKEGMLKAGFEHVGFIYLSRVGLLTKNNKTSIAVGSVNFEKYDCAYLKAKPELTQFVEPLADELREKGIYCNVKPESYYIISNKPYLYSLLHQKKIEAQKTTVIHSPSMVLDSMESFSYPVIIKTFDGIKKTQSLVIDSLRGLKSFIKSIKSNVSAVTIQDYLQGDVFYCAVVGENVFSYKRKWLEDEFEHSQKMVSVALSDDEKEKALRAANACSLDIALVKMIQGKIINVNPLLDITKFNKALGKEIQETIGHYFMEKAKGD
jgi:glutathione synthase/RimK-type ligase-like ATP-grasp enzyme